MDWFPSLICKNHIFKHFVKTLEPTSLKFCMIITLDFTSGVHNCASKICKFLLCACADLCFVKWRNGNSFYWLQKPEILVVVTSDCLLREPNRLLKDLLRLNCFKRPTKKFSFTLISINQTKYNIF